MKKEMLINVAQPEECRIAILEDGVLEELYVERTSHESYVGNIYKGRIVNIEPSIQAAFVDFGVGRNGFLHISDVEPTYYRHLEERRDRGDDRGGRGDAASDRRAGAATTGIGTATGTGNRVGRRTWKTCPAPAWKTVAWKNGGRSRRSRRSRRRAWARGRRSQRPNQSSPRRR